MAGPDRSPPRKEGGGRARPFLVAQRGRNRSRSRSRRGPWQVRTGPGLRVRPARAGGVPLPEPPHACRGRLGRRLVGEEGVSQGLVGAFGSWCVVKRGRAAAGLLLRRGAPLSVCA